MNRLGFENGVLLVSIYNKKEALSFERTSLKVVPDGLEPPLTEPKTVVLPLHHGTINGCKGTPFRGCHQILTQLFYA